MKKLLVISVFLNILFIALFGYIVHRKGGIDYLKNRFFNDRGCKKCKYMSHYYTKKSIFEAMPDDTNEIVFLGNSISDNCDWYELFRDCRIKNRGVDTDIIDGVIERLDEVVRSKPKQIFLMIGTNDLKVKKDVALVLSDYERLIKLIIEKTPETELFIQSVLPTYHDLKRKNSDIIEINKGLIELSQKYDLQYIELFDLFLNENQELDTAYSFDGLHVNGKAYLIWKKAIEKYVNG
ncbi:MAG: G-D-S-L family lipolytic protein [Bacteroidetes bacterium]|nr:G-D-S-L family lipolytic protein [Bacteroidota bacterium]